MARKRMQAVLVAVALLQMPSMALAKDIRVTYAGSMGKVMDQGLGPAFPEQITTAIRGRPGCIRDGTPACKPQKLRPMCLSPITPGADANSQRRRADR